HGRDCGRRAGDWQRRMHLLGRRRIGYGTVVRRHLTVSAGEGRAVSELVIPHVDDVVLDDLRQCAARHGRTTAEEARTILTNALRGDHVGAWATVDEIYERLAASGRNFTDSANLLREDRDR